MTPRPLILCALLLAAPLAGADELPFLQLAVHAGYSAGGGLEDSVSGNSNDLDDGGNLALALEFRYGKGDDRYLQLWYSRQESGVDDGGSQHDVNVEYLHFGGTVPIGDHEKAQGYFAMGIGATRFSASGADAESRTKFSGSIGLGVAMPISAHAAVRLEARGYVTLVDSNASFFCRAENGTGFCNIVASGSTIVQGQLLAGIAVSF
jgi:hypothetical protein